MKDKWCKIMLFMHKKCQNIDHDEDIKEFDDYFSFNRFDRTEVEPSPTGRYSSHQRWAHSWENSPSASKLSYFLPHDFANFWSEVRYWYSKTSNTAGFLIKIFLNDPIKKNCFFDHSVNFLVNFLSQDFVQTLRNENLEG